MDITLKHKWVYKTDREGNTTVSCYRTRLGFKSKTQRPLIMIFTEEYENIEITYATSNFSTSYLWILIKNKLFGKKKKDEV